MNNNSQSSTTTKVEKENRVKYKANNNAGLSIFLGEKKE